YEEGKPVLSDVSFTVKEGTTLGILGGTGSGKSTIAYLLDGLYPLTSGKITIGGADNIKSAQSAPAAEKLRFFGLGKMKPFLKPHIAKFAVMVAFTLIV